MGLHFIIPDSFLILGVDGNFILLYGVFRTPTFVGRCPSALCLLVCVEMDKGDHDPLPLQITPRRTLLP